MLAAILFACTVVSVHDGDTLTCRDGTKVRLAAIDAPEIGPCRGRRGRVCVPGDGPASRNALNRLVLGRTIRCEKAGMSYQRVVAWCGLNGIDLSCSMMRGGYAVRVAQYDRRARLCRAKP